MTGRGGGDRQRFSSQPSRPHSGESRSAHGLQTFCGLGWSRGGRGRSRRASARRSPSRWPSSSSVRRSGARRRRSSVRACAAPPGASGCARLAPASTACCAAAAWSASGLILAVVEAAAGGDRGRRHGDRDPRAPRAPPCGARRARDPVRPAAPSPRCLRGTRLLAPSTWTWRTCRGFRPWSVVPSRHLDPGYPGQVTFSNHAETRAWVRARSARGRTRRDAAIVDGCGIACLRAAAARSLRRRPSSLSPVRAATSSPVSTTRPRSFAWIRRPAASSPDGARSPSRRTRETWRTPSLLFARLELPEDSPAEDLTFIRTCWPRW